MPHPQDYDFFPNVRAYVDDVIKRHGPIGALPIITMARQLWLELDRPEIVEEYDLEIKRITQNTTT